MKKNIDLLNGSVTINLFKLSIPVILTSLMSILYNLTDIKFISKYLGDNAVSSATAASFYIGLSYSLLLISKNGAQIYVAQSIGSNQKNSAKRYARASIIITVCFALIYSLIIYFLSENMIKLVGVKTEIYLYPAIDFLKISCYGFIFLFLSQTLTAIINGQGDTLGPFIFLSFGVILNILLDYIFLAILKFGIKGAAIATVFSQFISFVFLWIYFKRKKSIFRNMKLIKYNGIKYYKKIIKLGIPSGINQALFTFIAIIIAQMISKVDESILGVQRLGVQIEAFSWNIAAGFATAVATFIAFCYGAKRYDKIIKIYKVAILTIISLCLMLTIIFIFFARDIYLLFFNDKRLIELGVQYLTIIGLAQIPQGIETITTGAFNGIGKTKEPNLISIIGTLLRIPIIKFLLPIFGIISIWWTIHFSMVFKGLISFILFIIIYKKELKKIKEKSYL